MKIPLHQCNELPLLDEAPIKPESRCDSTQPISMVNHFKKFKLFITASILILLMFISCIICYYQLNSTTRHNEHLTKVYRFVEIIDNGTTDNSLLAIITGIVEKRKKMKEPAIENFTILKIYLYRKSSRARLRRSINGGEDETNCKVHFSFDAKSNGKLFQVKVDPFGKNLGNINVTNVVNYAGKAPVVRECSFKITYVPRE